MIQINKIYGNVYNSYGNLLDNINVKLLDDDMNRLVTSTNSEGYFRFIYYKFYYLQ